ncbi:hypothetical protein [Kribbella qitaiheensis]|nr:hypothetical protein [Kribbella qitaiheensis]
MAMVLWTFALTLTIAGMICAIRYKLVLGGVLIAGGLTIGIYAGSQLP